METFFSLPFSLVVDFCLSGDRGSGRKDTRWEREREIRGKRKRREEEGEKERDGGRGCRRKRVDRK